MMSTDVRTRSGLAPVLVEIIAIAGRRLRHLRRAPGRFVGVTMNPLVSMIVFGYLFKDSISIPGGGDYQEYLFAGAAIQVGLAGVGPTAVSVAMDLQGGLIDRFRSLPISRSAVLFGHVLADLVVGLFGLAIVTVFGLLVGWTSHGSFLDTLGAFGLVAVFIYVMLWVGVLLGMASKSVETIDSISSLVVIVLPFLSNAFLATENLPVWLRPIAEWNPISAVASACRQLWGNPVRTGDSFPADNPTLVVVVSLGLMFLCTSLLSLRRYRTAQS
jgi:ABC transporter DrrB family efflux protein